MQIRVLTGLYLASTILAQSAAAQHGTGFGTCVPRSQPRADSVGCFIVVERPIGLLGTTPVFWHISRFSTRRDATAARPTHGTVIEAYNQVWLMVIGGASWRPRGGTQIAAIGPLPITPGRAYSALYMEASMRPGMKSVIHRHSGPEAWYTLNGQTCLETPNGTTVGRAGGAPVIIPGGLPMELTATGTELRRSLVLILHDARKPPTTPVTDWKPRGECRNPARN